MAGVKNPRKTMFGWVLMENHYHWFIETPETNLVEGKPSRFVD
jgi:hypothetical protein